MLLIFHRKNAQDITSVWHFTRLFVAVVLNVTPPPRVIQVTVTGQGSVVFARKTHLSQSGWNLEMFLPFPTVENAVHSSSLISLIYINEYSVGHVNS